MMCSALRQIVSGLSDAYAILRLREHPEEEGVWAPPSEFNRKTTKYWVKPEDVLSIKVRGQQASLAS